MKAKLTFSIVFSLFFLQACNPVAVSTLTKTPSPLPTHTLVLPTFTPTPIYEWSSKFSPLNEVPAGEYLVQDKSINDKCRLNYYNINGDFISEQSFNVKKCSHLSLSGDGSKIAIVSGEYPNWNLSILDTKANSLLEISEAQGCMRPSWSPSGSEIALYCNFKDIFILSLNDRRLTQLTTWSIPTYEDTWDYPAWSPDGKWVAYINLPDFQRSETDGVYITKSICLQNSSTCREETIGAIIPYDNVQLISWAPNSQEIAFAHDGYEIYTYNILSKVKSKLMEFPSIVEGLSWSPSGQWIAVSEGGNVHLLSSNGKQVEKIKTTAGTISFWIQIPYSNINVP